MAQSRSSWWKESQVGGSRGGPGKPENTFILFTDRAWEEGDQSSLSWPHQDLASRKYSVLFLPFNISTSSAPPSSKLFLFCLSVCLLGPKQTAGLLCGHFSTLCWIWHPHHVADTSFGTLPARGTPISLHPMWGSCSSGYLATPFSVKDPSALGPVTSGFPCLPGQSQFHTLLTV